MTCPFVKSLTLGILEPYLAKFIIKPDQSAIGSTEWVGLKCAEGIDPLSVGYMLMLPQLREAYRCLKSGKRQARLDIKEMLELEVDVDPKAADAGNIESVLERISMLEKQIVEARISIDDLFL